MILPVQEHVPGKQIIVQDPTAVDVAETLQELLKKGEEP
jgi:hypothetical protein